MNFATQAIGKHSTQDKAQSDLAAAQQARTKLTNTPPHFAQLVMMRVHLPQGGRTHHRRDGQNNGVQTGAKRIGLRPHVIFAKQLVSVYAKQQAQIARLAKQVEEIEKMKAK